MKKLMLLAIVVLLFSVWYSFLQNSPTEETSTEEKTTMAGKPKPVVFFDIANVGCEDVKKTTISKGGGYYSKGKGIEEMVSLLGNTCRHERIIYTENGSIEKKITTNYVYPFVNCTKPHGLPGIVTVEGDCVFVG